MDLQRYVHHAITLAVACVLAVGVAPSVVAAPSAANDAVGTVSQQRVTPYCYSMEPSCPIKCYASGVRARSRGAVITEAWRNSHAFYGRTSEEVQQKFAVVIERNLSRKGSNAVFSNLSTKELSDLAQLYVASAPAGDTGLYRILAKRLDAQQLVRAAAAFGTAPISSAVREYSSARVQRTFTAQMVMNLQASHSDGPKGARMQAIGTMATSHLFMTLQEIYLDFRTDPVGGLGVRDALVETGTYAGGELSLAWTGGSLAGDALNSLIQTYAPSLYNAIGGTEVQMVQDIEDATTEFGQGHYEQSLDSLFGSPLGSIGDYTGDDDVGASYGFYESQVGGGGGC